jgi:hypothetical protein
MIALSFMAIIVSLEANEISTNQSIIMNNENKPDIDIIFYVTPDDSTNIPTSVWNIYNRGGRITKFTIDDISFIRTSIKKGYKYQEKLIPIYTYLDLIKEFTGETIGLVEIIKNTRFKSKYIQLYRSFLGKGEFEIETYIKVSYLDYLNQPNYKYFSLSPVEEIPNYKCEYLNNYHQTKDLVDLNSMNFEKIDKLTGY